MPKPSSDTVRVFFANKDRALESARKAVAKLARRREEITRVVLFGSYARDDYGPGSDLDLLFILDHSDKSDRERIGDYLDLDLDLPFEVIALTQQEIDDRIAAGDPFLKTILSEGIQVFPAE